MRQKLFSVMAMVCLSTLTVYSQYAEIKKMILDDLVYLNEIYNGKIVINDTILFAVSNRIDEIVEIIHIDSFGRYYSLQVSFNGIHSNCYPLFMKKSLSTFDYIVYRNEDGFVKVNGFLISEVMSLPTSEIYGLKLVADSAYSNARIRKIKRAIKYRNMSLLEGEFKSSILLSISNNIIRANPNSYLIDDRVLWCDSID